jgi:hypothetical protein
MPTYAVPADKCPALTYRQTRIPATPGVPTLAPTLPEGAVGQLRPMFNQLGCFAEGVAGYGAGGWGVVANVGGGLHLYDGAVAGSVSLYDGDAMIDGPVRPVSLVAPLVDNTYNYLWLNKNGAYIGDASADPDTPPAPPDEDCAYLGRVHMTAGVIAGVDESGRMEFHGGLSVRRTGDVGMPADFPPAPLVFFAQTAGGWYLWNGEEYLAVIDDKTVRADAVDTGGGALVDKLLTEGATLTVVVDGGVRKVRVAVAPVVHSLPPFDVTLPPNSDKVVEVDFSATGAFPTPHYAVSAAIDQGLDSTIVHEVPAGKTGSKVVLHLANVAVPAAGAVGTGTDVRVTLTLYGFGWVPASGGGAHIVTEHEFSYAEESIHLPGAMTADFAVDPDTRTYLLDNTAADCIGTLPASGVVGDSYLFVAIGYSGSHVMGVDPAGSDTIDGVAAGTPMTSALDVVEVMRVGAAAWRVVRRLP